MTDDSTPLPPLPTTLPMLPDGQVLGAALHAAVQRASSPIGPKKAKDAAVQVISAYFAAVAAYEAGLVAFHAMREPEPEFHGATVAYADVDGRRIPLTIEALSEFEQLMLRLAPTGKTKH